jgi:hypothetical protein
VVVPHLRTKAILWKWCGVRSAMYTVDAGLNAFWGKTDFVPTEKGERENEKGY